MILATALGIVLFGQGQGIQSFVDDEVPPPSLLRAHRLEDLLSEARIWIHRAKFGPQSAPPAGAPSPADADYLVSESPARITILLEQATVSFSLDTGKLEDFMLRRDERGVPEDLADIGPANAERTARSYWAAAGRDLTDVSLVPARRLDGRAGDTYLFTVVPSLDGIRFQQNEGTVAVDRGRGSLVQLGMGTRPWRVVPDFRKRIGADAAEAAAVAAIQRFQPRPLRLEIRRPTLALEIPSYENLPNELTAEHREQVRTKTNVPIYTFRFEDPDSFSEDVGIRPRVVTVKVDARTGRALAIDASDYRREFRGVAIPVANVDVWAALRGSPIFVAGKKLPATAATITPTDHPVDEAKSVAVSLTSGKTIYALHFERASRLVWYPTASGNVVGRPTTTLVLSLDKIRPQKPFWTSAR